MTLEEFVSKYFPNATRIGDNAFKAICPTHNDNTPSLSITYKDGKILLNCPVCSMDKSQHKAKFEELVNSFSNPKEFLHDLCGNEYSQSTQSEAKKFAFDYTLEDYSHEKKINFDLLIQYGCNNAYWISKAGKTTNIKCVSMDYLSPNRTKLATRYRVHFAQNNKTRVIDGYGARKYFYGLQFIEEFSNRAFPEYPDTTPYVIFVEGESDCHTLWSMGYPALGIPGTNTHS